MTIRPARTDDAAAILRVHRDAILTKAARHYEPSVLEAWGVGETAERIARQQRQIASADLIVLVAEEADDLLGFAIAHPARQELRSLYVKPNPIGRVGRALLQELESRAFKSAEFLVCDASLNAVEFYQAHGYKEEGATSHVLRSGVIVPCLRMRKARS